MFEPVGFYLYGKTKERKFSNTVIRLTGVGSSVADYYCSATSTSITYNLRIIHRVYLTFRAAYHHLNLYHRKEVKSYILLLASAGPLTRNVPHTRPHHCVSS